MKPTDSAGQTGVFGDKTASPHSGAEVLNSILDETCIRLEDIRNQGALKRIEKLRETLQTLETGLTMMLGPD